MLDSKTIKCKRIYRREKERKTKQRNTSEFIGSVGERMLKQRYT